MNSVICLSESIRTNTGGNLSRTISLKRMQDSLIGLFADRTKINTSFGRFFNKDNLKVESPLSIYRDCMNLNDEKTIEWNDKVMNKISGGVLVNELELKPHHNMFIPFDDGDKK